MDKHQSPSFLPQLIVGEIAELTESLVAYQRGEGKIERVSDEFGDILVFFASYLLAQRKGELPEGQSHVNGFGRKSGALEELSLLALDIQDDRRTDKASKAFIEGLLSVAAHLPVPYVALTSFFPSTIRKVKANYPLELFSAEKDPIMGRELAPEEIFAKYTHLKQGTGMIRNKVGRTLRRGDWLPHQVLLQDWTASAANLQKLQNRLNLLENGNDSGQGK